MKTALLIALALVGCTPTSGALVLEDAEASQALAMGVSESVSLTTTVKNITGVEGANWVTVSEGTVDVYLVLVDVADGAAVPSDGRELIPQGSIASVKIDGIGSTGVAAVTGTGTVRLRYIR